MVKWILTFLAGALCGAGALLYFLGRAPYETVLIAPAVVAAPVVIQVSIAALPGSATIPTTAVTPTLAIADSLPVQSSAPVLPIEPPPIAVAAAKPDDKLLIPVTGVKASQLTDTFGQSRGTERSHEALDIIAPKGTQVVAVADGKVVKLFNSKPGGLTVYQFDKNEKFAYYYAHLDHYASGLTEGTFIKQGDLLGYVGSTGNADSTAPHLHFAIFELTPEKQWWKGVPLNPYPLLRE